MPQLLHPRVLRPFFFLVLGSLIVCGYIAAITVIIVRLIQGADLRLIALSVLLASAVAALNSALYCLLILPEWTKQLLGWRTLINVGHWPRKTALLLWMRVKYGKQQPGIYTPVDSPSRQTRLLVVEAGQSSDEIRCSLLPVYLQNDCPEFEALSYTWGQRYSPRHIVLNGSPFAITLNLYEALKQLRRNDVSRVLWVDALSIDQSNIPERSEQVSLMKLIFASASNVIIWLGEGSVSTRHAMDLLCSASEQVDPYTWLSDRLKITFQSNKTQWKALLSLFRRDYWSRTWIIQETAVATKLEIVCGSLRCKWEVALAAQSAWMDFKAMMLSREQQDIIDSMEGSVSLEEEIPGLVTTLIPKNNGPMTLSINRHNFSLARASSLVGLLQRNWTAQATDPRDRIFALLGLATDCQRPTLSADYSLSQWEVYLRMMNFLLENYGNLDIIAYSGLGYFPRPGHFLNPSWTPTFYWATEAPSTAVTSQYLYIHPDKLGASSNRKARAKFLPQRKPFDKIFGINRTILRAQICRIDRISKSLFTPANNKFHDLPSDLIALQKKLQIASTWLPVGSFSGSARHDRILVDELRTLYHYFVLNGELSSHDQSAEGKLQKERKTEILWRTLVLNRKIDGTTAPDSWSSIFAVIVEGPSLLPANFEAPQVGLSADNRAAAYIQPFLQATNKLRVGGRCLFTTDSGRLGIANYSARVGDYVCVILGCNMPMIMREYEKRKGNEFVQAQLCGPAYMHEYMQGKAVEELDIGQLTLRTVEFV